MNLVERVLADNELGINIYNVNANSSISGLVTKITTWIGAIAGVIAFFFLIYSGILYLTAGGNTEQTKKALQGIVNSVIGLAIIILSYAILRVILNTLAK